MKESLTAQFKKNNFCEICFNELKDERYYVLMDP